jgi:hypothetical protein
VTLREGLQVRGDLGDGDVHHHQVVVQAHPFAELRVHLGAVHGL